MIRSRLRDLIRKRLGETTASFWSADELNDWINDAGHEIAYRTKCIKANGKLTTVASTSEYTLSGTFPNAIAVLEVYHYLDGTTWVRLAKTDRDTLSRDQRGWKSAEASVPYKYYYSEEEDTLGLYPKPNSGNAGTSYMEVYYANDFSDMTIDADSPTYFNHELQLAMIDFVVATGYETRGWGDKANDAWSKYNGRLEGYMQERSLEDEDDDDYSSARNYKKA